MCLIPGHITRECTNPVKCQAKKCGQRHATMLHEADWEGLRQTSREKREAKAGSPPENEGYMVTTLPVITMSWEARLPFPSC